MRFRSHSAGSLVARRVPSYWIIDFSSLHSPSAHLTLGLVACLSIYISDWLADIMRLIYGVVFYSKKTGWASRHIITNSFLFRNFIFPLFSFFRKWRLYRRKDGLSSTASCVEKAGLVGVSILKPLCSGNDAHLFANLETFFTLDYQKVSMQFNIHNDKKKARFSIYWRQRTCNFAGSELSNKYIHYIYLRTYWLVRTCLVVYERVQQ